MQNLLQAFQGYDTFYKEHLRFTLYNEMLTMLP